MTTEEFANVGVFVIALVGYLSGTGLFGCFITSGEVDDKVFYILAWLSGAIIFAVAVTIMRG